MTMGTVSYSTRAQAETNEIFALVVLQDADGKLNVTLVDSKTRETVSEETYDTVFFATGRRADTSNIGLEAVGVKVRSCSRLYTWALTSALPSALSREDLLDQVFRR